MPTNILSKEQYLEDRNNLIEADRSLRRDRASIQARSALEAEADEIIRRIRTEEATSIWRAEHPDIPHPFPGMEFLTGKQVIEETRIFEILSRMPKGALLHIHIGATVNTRTLLALALQQPAIHIRVPQLLSVENISSVLPEFMSLPTGSYNLDGESVSSNEYLPNTWVNAARARERFDPSLGGPEGFDRWIVNAMTLTPLEAYGTHNTVTKRLVHFLPIFKQYLRIFLLASVDDGISYVEVRMDFYFAKDLISADGKRTVTHREVLELFDATVNEVKGELVRENRGHKFLGARIIYTAFRALDPKDLYYYVDDCLNLKKEFPHIIAGAAILDRLSKRSLNQTEPGFDLVGNEDELRPLIDYIEPLLYFRKRQAQESVEIPFLFHAGETLGDGNLTDDNMYDALLLGTRRIGHGFSLVKHPKLLQACRERNILLEVCPISNEVLRLTSSMPTHPLPTIINHGVPVALCSDGPSVFGNMGLTYDFFQLLVSSEITGLSTLGVLARDSIQFSMMLTDEKQIALEIWEAEWSEFLQFIVAHYKQ
ncbi:hypothetical protein NP233_g846 [Leucocoprinus birnbaumii]|uniref:adenosine deaminase n=1 Tax=Leucocoprinus birnbaumii TaxID=56174 RepID=A0AAD5YWD6_9AGAR|nr:hypothetical protein NP233_g846 [Leucocoprinus birnbaumii]